MQEICKSVVCNLQAGQKVHVPPPFIPRCLLTSSDGGCFPCYLHSSHEKNPVPDDPHKDTNEGGYLKKKVNLSIKQKQIRNICCWVYIDCFFLCANHFGITLQIAKDTPPLVHSLFWVVLAEQLTQTKALHAMKECLSHILFSRSLNKGDACD